MRIGVLALQGDFQEHIDILRRIGADGVPVRLPEELQNLDGLIIPGGESTTIGKLASRYGLVAPLRRFASRKAVWGTCAGMILMASRVGGEQPHLAIMDMTVARNAFGRQVDSFETDLTVSEIENGSSVPFPAVFIRAPKVLETWGEARVIARLSDGTIVAVQQNRHLATAFHPELSRDFRVHRLFLNLAGS